MTMIKFQKARNPVTLGECVPNDIISIGCGNDHSIVGQPKRDAFGKITHYSVTHCDGSGSYWRVEEKIKFHGKLVWDNGH
jgi:hypothetical protein